MSGNNDNDFAATMIQMQAMQNLGGGNTTAGIFQMNAVSDLARGDKDAAMLDLQMANMFSQMEQQQKAEEERRRKEAIIRQQQEEERRRQEAERLRLAEEARKLAYQNYMQQGTNFAQANQFDAALVQFNQALEAAVQDEKIMPRYNIAWCYEKKQAFLQAYTLFSDLIGHSHSIPNFSDHLNNCAHMLEQISAQHFQEASRLYTIGDHQQAKSELSIAKQHAPQTQQGNALLKQIQILQKQIEWDAKRGHVNHTYAEGAQRLSQQAFEQAQTLLNDCQASYKEFSAYLYPEDKKNYQELPELLRHANRGVEILRNIHHQNDINKMLELAKTHIAGYKLLAAIDMFHDMVILCKKITVPNDVLEANIRYFPPLILQDALTELQNLQAGFEKRRNDESTSIVTQILNNITAPITLSDEDKQMASNSIINALKVRWDDLDQRELDALPLALTETLRGHLLQYNCLIACCYSGSHYIDDLQALTQNVQGTIDANIPRDTREPIKLAIFAPQPYSESAARGMFFQGQQGSGYNIPVATAVDMNPSVPAYNTADEDKDAKPGMTAVMF